MDKDTRLVPGLQLVAGRCQASERRRGSGAGQGSSSSRVEWSNAGLVYLHTKMSNMVCECDQRVVGL